MVNIKKEAIALVTGASGSIGSATAKALHEAGAHVILTSTNQEKLNALKDELGNNCTVHPCDLSNLAECKNLISIVKNDFANIDILVCNAGITKDSLCVLMSEKSFSEVIKINLESIFTLNKEAIKLMLRANNGGRIINISSVVAFSGNIGQANYCASKAAIIGMTKAIAREVANRQITVNAIAPGFIKSNMTNSLAPNIKEMMLAQIPMARFGLPKDIASAILYLASIEASYITGSTLHVNGGMYMA